MDHFGIGAAILGAARIYQQSARHTGRTESLINSLKDGDRVCFTDGREAERVYFLCLERGIKIETMIIDPNRPELVFNRAPANGRTIFDHSWVEEYYALVIKRAIKDIDSIERQASGYGSAHYETRRKAEEVAKWSNK